MFFLEVLCCSIGGGVVVRHWIWRGIWGGCEAVIELIRAIG